MMAGVPDRGRPSGGVGFPDPVLEAGCHDSDPWLGHDGAVVGRDVEYVEGPRHVFVPAEIFSIEVFRPIRASHHPDRAPIDRGHIGVSLGFDQGAEVARPTAAPVALLLPDPLHFLAQRAQKEARPCG